MTGIDKLALARSIAGLGRSIGGLGVMGAGSWGLWRAGNELRKFNPQNPAAVGQSIAQMPARMNQNARHTNEVIDWAASQGR